MILRGRAGQWRAGLPRAASRLADTEPARYTPDLASSLNNLGRILYRVGDFDGELRAVAEAVAGGRG